MKLDSMWPLTGAQFKAIGLVILLLLTGWMVKAWRTAHPADAAPTTAGAE